MQMTSSQGKRAEHAIQRIPEAAEAEHGPDDAITDRHRLLELATALLHLSILKTFGSHTPRPCNCRTVTATEPAVPPQSGRDRI